MKKDALWFIAAAAVLLLFLNGTLPNTLLQMFTIDPVTRFSIDPFVYTSYIHNYSEVVERYGRIYSAARLAFIYPARFMAWAFGSESGYLILRNLLVLGLLGAVWKLCLKYYHSKRAACFTLLAIALHPWLLRSVFWNYIDGFAAVYLLISISFAAGGRVSYFFSGVFASMAVNCHLLAGAVLGAFLPSWILLNRQSSAKFKDALSFLAGFFSLYLLFAAGMYGEFPHLNPFYENDLFNITKFLFTGGGVKWMMSLEDLLGQGKYYLLYPVFLLVFSSLFYRLRKEALKNPILGQAALLFLFLSLALYACFHFVFQISVLSFLYYTYIIPPVFFLFIWLIGEAALLGEGSGMLTAGAALYCLIWLGASLISERLEGVSGAFFSSLGLFFLGTLALIRRDRFQSALALSAVLASPLVFYRDSIYAAIHQKGRQDWDIYRGAVFLQNLIFDEIDAKAGKVGFWYSNRNENQAINSIHSMFLWLYSRLCDETPQEPGMPVVDAYFRKNISRYKFVALLGLTKEEIDRGAEALSAEGLKTRLVLEREFHSGDFGFHVAVFEKSDLP